MRFDRASLEAEGFTGWLTFPEARASGAIPMTGVSMSASTRLALQWLSCRKIRAVASRANPFAMT